MTTSSARSHLVFGDDGSPGADVAWLWITCQQWPGWRMTVLRADPPPLGTTVDPAEAGAHPDDHAGRPIVSDAGLDSVDFQVAAADPRIALTSVADTDLLVVGDATSGIGRRRIGSTTEWLLHDPLAPMVLARRGRPVRRAMVCADGSRHAAAAASALASLPWSADLAVEVISIDDGRSDPVAAISAITELLPTRTEVVRSTRRGSSPHREILEAAEQSDPDLIVLGTHGLTTMRRLTFGSTASAIARQASCSVLVAQHTRVDA
ncbi:universal stress protein [Actinospongicola halichondriae]|uniref:universal stress protein n=1 Tax=Actinospongicola halichondriae TaxID=3236844 RepID=UPI003D3C6243